MATLRLKHNYPHADPGKTAHVNIRVVLESMRNKMLDVGSWVNVIGYVERHSENDIFVQAVAVWDAGNIDLDAYQNGVEARKEVQ
jgi:hypothetical protein